MTCSRWTAVNGWTCSMYLERVARGNDGATLPKIQRCAVHASLPGKGETVEILLTVEPSTDGGGLIGRKRGFIYCLERRPKTYVSPSPSGAGPATVFPKEDQPCMARLRLWLSFVCQSRTTLWPAHGWLTCISSPGSKSSVLE